MCDSLSAESCSRLSIASLWHEILSLQLLLFCVRRTSEHNGQNNAIVLGGAATAGHENWLAGEVTGGRPGGLHGAGRQIRLADAREPWGASLRAPSQRLATSPIGCGLPLATDDGQTDRQGKDAGQLR